MKNIQVCREHNLGQEGCQELADKIIDNLIARIGGSKMVQGNVIHYKHVSGSKGTLTSDPDCLKVDVSLGFLVRSFGSSIEQEIHGTCDEYLKR